MAVSKSLRIIVAALGICSVVSILHATEAGEMDASKDAIADSFTPDSGVSLRLPFAISENVSLGAVAESSTGEGEESASELNRKLTNPVSSIWSISNQFNNFELNNGQWNNNWNFQPVMPVNLTKDWNLITRPVMPFYNIVPRETSPGEFARDAGLGDLTLLELLSPANSGNWVLGAGPTAIFATATSHFTGQGKWQLGPSVVVGYLTKQFFIGVFPQQWWSIGGEHGRPDTNQMNLQPIATLFFGEGWSIGYSGNILASWNAPSEDVWTVPIGVGLAKVGPVHARASPDLWTGVECAGLDYPGNSEADQGRPLPVRRNVKSYRLTGAAHSNELEQIEKERVCLGGRGASRKEDHE